MPRVKPESRVRSEFGRFWGRVYPHPSGCWLWWGCLDKDGYGWFYDIEGKNRKAHRTAYVKWYGAIPDGMVVDHLCRNRMCVFPEHLQIVAPAENTYRRAMAQSKCKRGHAYTIEYRQGHRRVCQYCVQLNKTRRLAGV